MADNSLQNGTDNIATDDLVTLNGGAVSGVKVQRVKVGFGSDSALRDVDTLNPLPVGGGFVSTANSTTTNLAAAGAFTGTAEDVSQYSSVTVSIYTSHVSATDGLSIQQSSDGTNWDIIDAYNIPATTGKTFAVQVAAKYLRVVYTNGATLTTTLRIQTIFHSISMPTSSVRPQDGRTNDNDMEEALAYGMVYNGTSWDRLRGLNGAMSITGSQTAATTAAWTSATTVNTALTVSVVDMNTVTVAMSNTSTMTAGVLTFEVSPDNVNWFPIAMARIDSYTVETTYTLNTVANRAWSSSVDGFTNFRVRLSTVITGTGTASLVVTAQAMPIEPVVTVGQSTASLLNATVTQGAAGATPWLTRHAAATTNSGLLVSKVLSAATTNATLIASGLHALYGYHLVNNATSTRYLRLYNLTVAPTVGTSVPYMVIPLPPGGGALLAPNTTSLPFSTGLSYAITAGAADLDATATAANDVVGTIWYI